MIFYSRSDRAVLDPLQYTFRMFNFFSVTDIRPISGFHESYAIKLKSFFFEKNKYRSIIFGNNHIYSVIGWQILYFLLCLLADCGIRRPILARYWTNPGICLASFNCRTCSTLPWSISTMWRPRAFSLNSCHVHALTMTGTFIHYLLEITATCTLTISLCIYGLSTEASVDD